MRSRAIVTALMHARVLIDYREEYYICHALEECRLRKEITRSESTATRAYIMKQLQGYPSLEVWRHKNGVEPLHPSSIGRHMYKVRLQWIDHMVETLCSTS